MNTTATDIRLKNHPRHNFISINILNVMKRLIWFSGILLGLIDKSQAQGNWKCIKSDDEIQVYYREPGDSGYYEMKAVTHANTSLNSAISVIQNARNYKEWMYRVEKSRKVKEFTDRDFIYYLVTDLPWPAGKRDMVMHLTIKPNGNKSIASHSKNVTGIIPPKDDIKRVKYMYVSWKFRATGKNTVKILYRSNFYSRFDPPLWLKKQLFVQTPLHNLKNFKEQISD